jgi:Uma2 family endonuclease
MATNTSTINTAEQLWAADIDQPCELIRGELVLMSPTNDDHSAMSCVLTIYLGHYILENKLGKVHSAEPGFIVERNPDTVRVPDFAFVTKEKRAKQGRSEKFMPYAPDLVVEVKSPSDSYKYVEEKTQQWLAAGCLVVIVVDPKKRNVKQYYADGRCETLDESDTLTCGELVPGWEFPVKRIFEE